MSDLMSPKPQILLNGEEHEPLQDKATISDQTEESSLEEENKEQSETQVKIQSILQQVRKQIRSQGGARTPKSNILALVQKVWEKEVTGDVENDISEEERQDERNNQREEEDECATLERKLEASKKALKEEFEAQILQLRNEMQVYTDQAIKELESKMLKDINVSSSPKEQTKVGPEKKLPSSAVPPVALRRGRVLTRTMTTIIPKTCTPVIVCPRAKSESLASSKVRLGRDNILRSTTAKPSQCGRPLPPAAPRQPKRPAQAKTKTVN
ncbi:unnamed protein product [Knipowitschia caucasica]|uniref:Uncharacterized protein n=1 Tax=Knipowitschia caucasica TaxID=637954 RepID=A0AAV2MRN6_KNICA